MEKLEKVDVNFLNSGDILSGILYDDKGNMFWPASTPVNTSFINELKENNIKFVYYSPPKFKTSILKEPIFSTETQEFAKNAIEEIANQITNGKLPDVKPAKTAIEKFFGEMQRYITGFLNLLVLREYDSYTYYHSINVGILSMYLTKKLGFNNIYSEEAGLGGFLHDIGKIKISQAIVNKRSALTPEEFKIMKNHPILGFELLKDDKSLTNYSKKMVLFHHERWDGSGYPLQLKSESIGNFAGIIAVCDVYDALTTERAYRKPLSVNEALIYIMRNTLTHFNPYASQRFINEMALMYDLGSFYPVGSFVILNTGEIGYITSKETEYTMRPEIAIIKNFEGVPLRNPIEADLRRDDTRLISKTIDNPSEIEGLKKFL